MPFLPPNQRVKALKATINQSINVKFVGAPTVVSGKHDHKERERSLFTMSEHNKYIYKLDNGRLPEMNNHHSWPPMIIEKNSH